MPRRANKRPAAASHADPRSLPKDVPKARKRHAAVTRVAETPLDIRVGKVDVEPEVRARMPAQLGRKIERYATNVTRVAVRFKDLNGPRGGIDTVCRIKLSLKGADHVVVEARAGDAAEAFRLASNDAKVALGRALGRRGPIARRPLVGRAQKPSAPARRAKRTTGGSLIGRRVGRTEENLHDVWAWEGEGSTAARNVKLRTSGMTATLEDSAKARPSRKSTRKSANRQKSGSKLARKTKRKLHAPQARARRAR